MATNIMIAALDMDAAKEAKIDDLVAGIIAALGQIDNCQDAKRTHAKIQALIRALTNGKKSRAELLSVVVSAK